jgi:hypothetical protein
VAKKMGQMFHSLNVLPTAEVVLRSASDFSTGYVGQAGKKAREIMTASIGRVLFIDEAYRLQTDTFMLQAVDELVQMLTEPQFLGKLVVILAGYEKDMDELMRVNQGLRSRISRRVVFPNFNVEDSCELMLLKLAEEELVLDGDASAALPALMKQLVDLDSFSNGRDVVTWANRVYRFVANRKYGSQKSSNDSDQVCLDDLQETLTDLLSERKVLSTIYTYIFNQ